MKVFPQIQIRQQFAKIGIDADHATVLQRQPPAKMEMKTVKPKLEIRQRHAEIRVDQSRAWDALGRGGTINLMNRIHRQLPELFLRQLAHKVEIGNRLAAIHTGENAIAEIAREEWQVGFPPFQYLGEASYDNVDIHVIARDLEFRTEQGHVDLRVEVRRPDLELHRGKTHIYMKQSAKVTIIPPKLDARI